MSEIQVRTVSIDVNTFHAPQQRHVPLHNNLVDTGASMLRTVSVNRLCQQNPMHSVHKVPIKAIIHYQREYISLYFSDSTQRERQPMAAGVSVCQTICHLSSTRLISLAFPGSLPPE